MIHFICTGGCRGVSNNPGTCQAKDCPKHGKPLIVCHCNDEKHKEAYGKENEKLK